MCLPDVVKEIFTYFRFQIIFKEIKRAYIMEKVKIGKGNVTKIRIVLRSTENVFRFALRTSSKSRNMHDMFFIFENFKFMKKYQPKLNILDLLNVYDLLRCGRWIFLRGLLGFCGYLLSEFI